jgi:hypothetical protein
LAEGRFAGESYLDEALAAAGVTVFHPESADLHGQFRLYRRARCLIFSEGSALHVLQLLGHLDAEIIILARRPWARMTAVTLRPRVRRLRYVRAARGFICGLLPSGHRQEPAGISVVRREALHSRLAGARDRYRAVLGPEAVVEIEFIGIWPSPTDGTVAITAAQLAYTRLAEPGAELATAGRGLIDK